MSYCSDYIKTIRSSRSNPLAVHACTCLCEWTTNKPITIGCRIRCIICETKHAIRAYIHHCYAFVELSVVRVNQPYKHGLIYGRDCLRCCTAVGPICTELRLEQINLDRKLKSSRGGCAAIMFSLRAVVQVHISQVIPTPILCTTPNFYAIVFGPRSESRHAKHKKQLSRVFFQRLSLDLAWSFHLC